MPPEWEAPRPSLNRNGPPASIRRLTADKLEPCRTTLSDRRGHWPRLAVRHCRSFAASHGAFRQHVATPRSGWRSRARAKNNQSVIRDAKE